MKSIAFALAGLVASTFLCSESVNSQSRRSRDVSVDGYYRRNGTYVAPYIRTSPNHTRDDNYSTRGNINPYTLEKGRQRRDSVFTGYGYEPTTPTTYSYPNFDPSSQPAITVPNLIQEINDSLQETPPLKVEIVQSATPTPTPTVAPTIPTPLSAPLQVPQAAPLQRITSTGEGIPQVPIVDALSFGETVSHMSAESAAEIRKTLDSVNQPKPNDVQKQMLDSHIPVQIDPKLSTQNNPFVLSSKPANVEERFTFEPPVLTNAIFSTACFGVFTAIIFVFLNRNK